MWFKIFCLLKDYTNAKLKRSSVNIHRPTKKTKYISYLSISVLKPVNPCIWFGHAI